MVTQRRPTFAAAALLVAVETDPDGVGEGRDVLFDVFPREAVLGEGAPQDNECLGVGLFHD